MSEGFEITAGDIPVILHVPHSSRQIPPDIRKDILLSDEQLKVELDEMTDSHTDKIASLAVADLSKQPWIFRNKLSRLVIDPERFPDEREIMNKVGMGAVYLKTSTGEQLR
ncbi:MAG: N-formylglutamate amidohydrolase, partial [Actinobacteria bacterium]|nr:N-formylglutamate amidohydrolase [Actinomycetota bacterium]